MDLCSIFHDNCLVHHIFWERLLHKGFSMTCYRMGFHTDYMDSLIHPVYKDYQHRMDYLSNLDHKDMRHIPFLT